ncbi:hypothetical protein F4777DRAFT_572521 [Nemania sp. FL0916]|nr:hypothetical protein F4777DRAFT_572521 [Nemania sp. FL0916]
MVGVPGRSKGCSTCRKRRKGCDKQRPACSQCSTAGLVCGGYERERIFLNRTQDTNARAVPVVYRKGLKDSSDGGVIITLPDYLAQTAYVDKYISVFLTKYLPAGRSFTFDLTGPSRDWVEIAHELQTSNGGIQLSLLSLGLFAAGESRLATQSYCRALRKLYGALSNPYLVRDDSTLATCQLLSLVEMFHGADNDIMLQGSKWHSHLSGFLSLIRTRTPHAYQSGVAHGLFTNGRYPLLVSALKDRQRFLLNTHYWRNIPWEQEPKSSLDKLYDILADLSELLADTDEMWRCDDLAQRANIRRDVLRACQCLDNSLKGWLEEKGSLAIFQDANGILINPTGSSDLLLAHMTVWYWTVYIILYSTMISIHDPPLSDIPEHINPLPYINNVTNALPYFWRPGAGLCGASLAAAPLGMCLHVAMSAPHRYAKEIAILQRLAIQREVASTVLPFLYSLHRSTGEPSLAGLEGERGMILRAQSWMSGKANVQSKNPV